MIHPENVKSARFKEMDETSICVLKELPKLHEYLQPLVLFDDDAHLEEYCLGYLQKKLQGKPLRAYYARKLYDYLLAYPEADALKSYVEPELLFRQKIPFVFEVILVIQYLHNHILDEKYDTKSQNHPKIGQNLVSSNVLRELLFHYINEDIAPHFRQPEKLSLFKKSLRKLLLWVDIGQYLDKNYNHYGVWKSGLPDLSPSNVFYDEVVMVAIQDTVNKVKADMPSKVAFVDAYFHRIYMSNVYFFRCMAETMMTLAEYRGKQHDPLLQYSIQYGFMLQIVNDYADFAYADDETERKQLKTAGKKTTDFFADLYNFNVTLPLMYHLKKGEKRKIEAYLEGGRKRKKILNEYPRQIRGEIALTGGIREAILRSQELAKSARTQLDEQNPQSVFFANMCDMAIDNKFYQLFK